MKIPGTGVVRGTGKPLRSPVGQERLSQKPRCLDQVSGSFLPLAGPVHPPILTSNSLGGSHLTKGHFTFPWGDSYLAHSPGRFLVLFVRLGPVHIPQRGAPSPLTRQRPRQTWLPAVPARGYPASSLGSALLPVSGWGRVVKAEAPAVWRLVGRSRSSVPKPLHV